MEYSVKYCRLVFATAFHNILEFAGKHWLSSIALTCLSWLVLIPLVHAYRLGWEAAYEEVQVGMSGLIALSLVGVVLFVSFLIYAPIQISKQRDEEIKAHKNSIQTLTNKVQGLEDKLKAKLSFIYESRPPYEDIKYISGTDRRQLSIFRIGVKNIGGVFLSQCSVILEALPIPGGGGQLPPKRLKLQSDNPYDTLNIGHKQSFSLAPGQPETIEIFRIDEQKGVIKICYAREEHRDVGLHDSLKMEGDTVDVVFNLRAIAEQGDSLIDTYCLKINRADNTMKFGTLTEFAKNNQLAEKNQDTNS